jgi:hypothetical protein
MTMPPEPSRTPEASVLPLPPAGATATRNWARALQHRLVGTLTGATPAERLRLCQHTIRTLVTSEHLNDRDSAVSDCIALLLRCAAASAHTLGPEETDRLRTHIAHWQTLDDWGVLGAALHHDPALAALATGRPARGAAA